MHSSSLLQSCIREHDTYLCVSTASPAAYSEVSFGQRGAITRHLWHASHFRLALTEHVLLTVNGCIRESRSLIIDAIGVMNDQDLLRRTLLNLEVLLRIKLVVAHAGRLSRC